jgi:hypothetical protein
MRFASNLIRSSTFPKRISTNVIYSPIIRLNITQYHQKAPLQLQSYNSSILMEIIVQHIKTHPAITTECLIR